MKYVVLLFCLASLCYGYSNPSLIDAVNQKQSTWVAGENPIWKGKSLAEIKSRFGWIKELEAPLTGTPSIDASLAIPTSFTAAANWPNCKTIGTIYDQARCGSCWAFGGVEAAADRFCIATKGTFNQALSFAQVVECDNAADGCEGGSNYAVWSFLQDNGVVTNACYPYYIPTCAPSQEPCLNFVQTPNCWSNNTCVSGSWTLYKIGNAYNLNSVADMQRDIMTKGPIEACFSVYEDFLHYKSGVYRHTSGSYLGGHCVKIQGWGEENGMPYWLVNNQWTTYWGNKGQFKIARGVDECGIEDDVAAGDPQVN
jgi:cathepsin B